MLLMAEGRPWRFYAESAQENEIWFQRIQERLLEVQYLRDEHER